MEEYKNDLHNLSGDSKTEKKHAHSINMIIANCLTMKLIGNSILIEIIVLNKTSNHKNY